MLKIKYDKPTDVEELRKTYFVESGFTVDVNGLEIKNNNDFMVYVIKD